VSETLAAWVLEGDDYVVLLDDDLRVVEANGSFRRAVLGGEEPQSIGFAETLAEASRGSFLALLEGPARDDASSTGERVELLHSVRGGNRSVRYSFLPCGAYRLLVGRDESAQAEIASQARVLGEEIAAEAPSDGTGNRSGETAGFPRLLDGPAFERATEERVRELRTEAERFSLVGLDIDNFRHVNEVHGHPTGDLVIGRVAEVLRENIREHDIVARVGGEEFMLLLPGLTLAEAAEVAERLRSAVEVAKMPDQVRRITISLGVVPAGPGSFATGSEAIALVERALEQAKLGGRNCVRSME